MDECYFKWSCRFERATLLKVTLLHGTNGAESRKASQISAAVHRSMSIIEGVRSS